jgi:hypothetical protein
MTGDERAAERRLPSASDSLIRLQRVRLSYGAVGVGAARE